MSTNQHFWQLSSEIFIPPDVGNFSKNNTHTQNKHAWQNPLWMAICEKKVFLFLFWEWRQKLNENWTEWRAIFWAVSEAARVVVELVAFVYNAILGRPGSHRDDHPWITYIYCPLLGSTLQTPQKIWQDWLTVEVSNLTFIIVCVDYFDVSKFNNFTIFL